MGAGAMTNNLPPLPPGFTLLEDDIPQPRVPPPPPGFTLEAEPAPLPDRDNFLGKVDTAIRGAADVLSWGTADEIAASLNSGSLFGANDGLWGNYDEELNQQRGIDADDAQNRFGPRLGGQIGGGVLGALALRRAGGSLAANAAQAGKGWLPRLLGGAADGGIQAGLYGFGSGEGLKDRAESAAYNVPLGVALGTAGEGIATGFGAGWRALFGGADDVARGVSPAANVKEAAEFGIPLSRAQATRSVAQANIEDQLGSQGTMQAFKAGQDEAVKESVGTVQSRLAGNNRPVPGQTSAWEAVQSGIRNTRDALKAAGKEAYKQTVDDPNILISGEAVGTLPNFIRSSLNADQIVIDPMYHVGASKALQFVDDYIARMPQVGGDVKGVQAQLKWIENLRASIGKNFPPIGQDAPALGAIKRAIDDWTDQVFESGLVSASDDVLDTLKTARAKWSEYKSLVEPRAKIGGRINPRYEAQARIRNLAEKDMSPSELGSYLFGASVAAPKNMSFATAQELKRLLGPDSAEWSGVRQAVWLRATRAGDEAMNPVRIAKNLDGLLKGDGQGLSHVLFSADERAAMQSFANVMRNLSLPKGGLNGSNTANRLMPQLQRWGSAVAGLLSGAGSAAGGLVDPMTGLILGYGTKKALDGLGAAKTQARAFTATRMPVPSTPTGAGGATLRGAAQPLVPMIEDMRRPPRAVRGR